MSMLPIGFWSSGTARVGSGISAHTDHCMNTHFCAQTCISGNRRHNLVTCSGLREYFLYTWLQPCLKIKTQWAWTSHPQNFRLVLTPCRASKWTNNWVNTLTMQPNNYFLNCGPLPIYSYLCAQVSTVERWRAVEAWQQLQVVFVVAFHTTDCHSLLLQTGQESDSTQGQT